MMNDEFILAFDNYIKNSSMDNEKKYNLCKKFIVEYLYLKTQELKMKKERFTISYMMSIFMTLAKKGIVNINVFQALAIMAIKVLYYQEAVIKVSIPLIIQQEHVMDFSEPIILLEEISKNLYNSSSSPEMIMAKDLLI